MAVHRLLEVKCPNITCPLKQTSSAVTLVDISKIDEILAKLRHSQ